MKLHRRPLTFPRELAALPRQIKLLSLLVGIYCMGWAIAKPFLPVYFMQILGSYAAVGLVTSLLYFFSLLWVMPVGSLLDRISKKWFLAAILILYIPLAPFLLALRTLAHFVFFRMYHSALATSLWTSLEVFVREYSPKRKRSEAFGLFDTGWALAVIIGPVIGGLLMSVFGFKIFFAISIFASLALIPLTLISEKKKMPFIQGLRELLFKDKLFKRGLDDFARAKGLISFAPFPFFLYFSNTFLHMLLPLFLLNLGATWPQVGIVVALFHLPRIFESYFSTVADIKGKKPILLKALLFGAIFFLIMFFVKSILALFLVCVMLSTCFSAIIPAMQGRLTELMPKLKIGELTGIIRAIEIIGKGAGPLIAGGIADVFGLRYAFLLGAGVFAGLLIFCSRLKF